MRLKTKLNPNLVKYTNPLKALPPMSSFVFEPEFLRMGKFMKDQHAKRSFDALKRNLADVDTFDTILDQNPAYLRLRFNKTMGDLDLHWTKYFDYNYMMIREDRKDLNRELHEYLYNPSRIFKWINEGNELEDYLM